MIKGLALLLSYAVINCNSPLPAKEPSPRPPHQSLTLDDLADSELRKALEPFRTAIKDQGCAKDFCFYLRTQVGPTGEEVSFSLSGSYNETAPPKEGIRAIFALCGAFWRYDPILGRERWIGQCLSTPAVRTIPLESIKTGQPLVLDTTVKNTLFSDARYQLPHVQLYFETGASEPALELGTLIKKD